MTISPAVAGNSEPALLSGIPSALGTSPLPTRLRPRAEVGVLDITKFFGATSGGIRTYLLEKSRYVTAHPGLRQTVVVPGGEDRVASVDGVRWYRVQGPPIPTQRPYRLLLRAATIRRLIEHEAPDLIEVGSPYLLPWMVRPIARSMGVPLVWFYHTNLPRILSPRPSADHVVRRLAGQLASRYFRRLRRVFTAAVGASDAAVRELEQAGFDRVVKVPLGTDLDHFHPLRRGYASDTRARFGLPSGPLVMYVGRLAREKELDLVIDAWPQVERSAGATLVVVGDGPARDYLRARNRARRVIWLVHQTDRERLADLIAAADLLVAPGPAETFGLAALEALSSGVPVLSSDVGAVRELVEASGGGLVNPAPNPPTMATSVLQLLGQDLAALGAKGRRYAEIHHGWSTVFDRLFGAYRLLIDDGHA
jgi:alpha-1,6-mannosyltransferase